MSGRSSRRRFLKHASISAVAGASVAGPVTGRRAIGNQTTESQATEIDGPTTITEPGRYEIVSDITSDTTDAIIRIQASDVTLDGLGHTLRGTGQHSSAGSPAGVINESSARNVEVRNMIVSGLFFGFNVVGAQTLFEDVVAMGNRSGFLINHSVHQATIRGSLIAHNSRGGIGAISSSGHTIKGNAIVSNGANGITFRQGCSDCTIAENAFQHNGERGFTAWEGGQGHVIVDNVAMSNGINGISINDFNFGDNPVRARKLFLARNIAVGNGADGLFFRQTDNSRIARNIAVRNGDDGIELDDADDNIVKRTVAVENGANAIRISSDSSGNRVWGNMTGW